MGAAVVGDAVGDGDGVAVGADEFVGACVGCGVGALLPGDGGGVMANRSTNFVGGR